MWSWTWNFNIALRSLNELGYNVVSSGMLYGIIGFELTIKENGQQWSTASTRWGTLGESMKTSFWVTLNSKFILWHCWPLRGPNENGTILKLINWRHETVFVHRRHSMDQVADFWLMPRTVLTPGLNGEQQEKVMIESVIMHKAAPQGEWTNYEASPSSAPPL